MSEVIILGVLIVASIGLIIFALLPSRKADGDHVRRRMAGRGIEQAEAKLAAVTSRRERSAAKGVIDKVTPIAMRPVMPASEEAMTRLREKLSRSTGSARSVVQGEPV